MINSRIEDKLLDNNTLSVVGPIDGELAKSIVEKILYLKLKFREECTVKPAIVLLINTPGGVVSEGMAIYDALKATNCRVITVSIGQASSMGAVLLSLGARGYRFALPNAEIMIHQPLGGAQGQATDIMIRAEHVMKLKGKLNKILSENTGQELKNIEYDTERDYYLTASDAVKYGLIDKILNDFSEVYDEIS